MRVTIGTIACYLNSHRMMRYATVACPVVQAPYGTERVVGSVGDAG